ncbi:unnamed protein product [Eruca vesicaria subsp. sativa]|uniref:Invertebrate defensins family profile domain-containing protein n=1 Tax=Eruca vesicaria subsp. sativa TaxID=29727 RepID=A0ABC8M343_ERUVS|nr:unnamed protein product [Eruca vesicaria subsp. sativa]
MAKSFCTVTLLMIFLLISTGIPKGKAQGEVVNNIAAPGTCRLENGQFICDNACKLRGFRGGICSQDITKVCLCYAP